MKASGNNRSKIFLTVFLVYLFYISPGYLAAVPYRYAILAKSIVDEKTFNIDKEYNLTCDRAFYKGHHYIGASPGLAFLAAPVYACLKPLAHLVPRDVYGDLEFNILNLFFIFFLSVLPGALLAVLLYGLLRKFEIKEKENLTLVFGASFGTILFYYSTKFFPHVIGTTAAFGAFYILFKTRHKNVRKYPYFIAGLLLGSSVLFEYTLLVAAVFFTLYAFSEFRKEKIPHYLMMLLGLSPAALLSMGYNYACFGNPFELPTKYNIKLGPVPFSIPAPRTVFELTFGTYRGMFLYMPILLLSVYGIFIFFRKPDKRYMAEMITISLYSVFVFLIVCMLATWHWPWGGDFGPRYLICLIPFLMLPAVFALKRVPFTFVFWLTILSVFVNWCGVQYGDADNVFTNMGLFIFMGLNSNLAEWLYGVTNVYVRKLNVVTHFSPLMGFGLLFAVLYLIWKDNIEWGKIRKKSS